MLNGFMFSSRTGEWETPQTFFDALDAEFHFTLDVCARPENAKCSRFFSPEQNGLQQSWAGETCWMNPPYGREIGRWVEKAYNEARRGAVVVALLPARTDTRWWHRYVMRAAEIRFVEGRLKLAVRRTAHHFHRRWWCLLRGKQRRTGRL